MKKVIVKVLAAIVVAILAVSVWYQGDQGGAGLLGLVAILLLVLAIEEGVSWRRGSGRENGQDLAQE